jgi:hypothetical protein
MRAARPARVAPARPDPPVGSRLPESPPGERIAGEPRRVRSIHLYGSGVELVVDAQAAPEDFLRVDRQVFAPLIASVRLARPVAG